MKPLSIAMFVGTFPVVSETFILRQITGLLDAGHQVDVFANSTPEAGGPVHAEVNQYRLLQRTTYMDGPPESIQYEMPVWPLNTSTWPPGSETSVHNSVRLARALPKIVRSLLRAPRLTMQALSASQYGYQAASLSTIYRLATLCSSKKRYDVLHAHFGPVANSFRFARELWRAPLVVSFHGYDFSTVPREEGMGVYRKLFAVADAVTVNSQYTRSQLEKLGCPSNLLHLLPVGFDRSELVFRERTRASSEPVKILTIARLTPIKGHEFVIRAIAKVWEKFPEVRYDIVGDGPLREKLQGLIEELKLQSNVKLHGSLDGSSIQKLLNDAHLFVLGSVSIEGDQEGQGLALQEAQAAGLPVIATQHGALPEGLLAGQSGFLVPERDVERLAERIEYLICHSELWREMGRAGRRFVEQRYDIRKLNQQLTEIYEQAMVRYGRA